MSEQYKSGFVAFNSAIRISLNLEKKLGKKNAFSRRCMGDGFPSLGFVEGFEFLGYSVDPMFLIGRLHGLRECRTVLILNSSMARLLWKSLRTFTMTDARAIRQVGRGVMFPRRIPARIFGRAKVVGVVLVIASLCVVVGMVWTIAVGGIFRFLQRRKVGQVNGNGSIRRLRGLVGVMIGTRFFKRELLLIKNYISCDFNLT
jgi:hypothetical protein